MTSYSRLVVASDPDSEPTFVAPSPVKARIIGAALELFAERGVGGTSLQMIADHIGVSKAAVYHQFKSKDDIVAAAAEAELARLEAVLAAAEAAPNRELAREDLIRRIVDLAIERRQAEGTLIGDPVINRFLAEHEPYLQMMSRMHRLLMGDTSGPETHVPAAMLVAAIGGAVMHPLVVDLDENTMRAQLLRLARRFLDLPD
jgi:AcrR family transcriptional regulator